MQTTSKMASKLVTEFLHKCPLAQLFRGPAGIHGPKPTAPGPGPKKIEKSRTGKFFRNRPIHPWGPRAYSLLGLRRFLFIITS